jgi:predicted acylesterase/phospholipase RssA
MERIYIAGTCDTNKGVFEGFKYAADQKPVTDHMYDSVLASSAMPGIFPPIYRDGMVLLDGGMVWKSDMNSAVQTCRDLGFEDTDIIIDWVMCDETHLLDEDMVNEFHSLKTGLRALGIQSYYNHMQDVEREKILFPHVNFRYTIGPSEKLTINPVPLDFSREHLERCIAIGEKDALNAIALGEGGYRTAMLEHYHNLEDGIDSDFTEIMDSALGTQKLVSQ